MAAENVNPEFSLKEETTNYFIEKIKQNNLTSKKHKNVCTALFYIEQSLVLVSIVTRCVLNFAFASVVGIAIGIGNSVVGLKLCALGAGIKRCK